MSSGGSPQGVRPHVTEEAVGDSHVRFYIPGTPHKVCIATVRTEYAQAFRDGLAAQYAPNAKTADFIGETHGK